MSWYADDRALYLEQKRLDAQQARAWEKIKREELMKAMCGETEQALFRGCPYWQLKIMDNPVFWVRPARVMDRPHPHMPDVEVNGLSYCKEGESQFYKATIDYFLNKELK